MRTALTLATLLAASLLPAFADVKYDYTGNPFNQFNGASGDTIANFVTISVTLSAALPNSQALTTASPISFDISDGLHTITDATPGVIFTTFQFGTDLTGAINHWIVIADTNSVGLQSFDPPGVL